MADERTDLRLLEDLRRAAEAAGWDVEWNWRDGADGTQSYDLYMWPKEDASDG
jgi:hypothetical protein